MLAQRRGEPEPRFTPAAELHKKTDARLAKLRGTPVAEIRTEWQSLIGFYGWSHGGVEILGDGESLLMSVEGGSPDILNVGQGTDFKFGKFDDFAYESVRFIKDDTEKVLGLAIGAGKALLLPRTGVPVTLLPDFVILDCPSD